MLFQRRPTFESEHISLKLSRRWKRVGGDDPTLAEFENSSEDMRLSVSVLGIIAPCNTSSELRRAVEDAYHVRIDVERKLIDPDDPIIANGVTEAAGRSLVFFCGQQRSSGRLFGGYLYGVGRVIVTLYLEGFGSGPKQHMECLVTIFNQLKIKNSN